MTEPSLSEFMSDDVLQDLILWAMSQERTKMQLAAFLCDLKGAVLGGNLELLSKKHRQVTEEMLGLHKGRYDA